MKGDKGVGVDVFGCFWVGFEVDVVVVILG